MSFRNRLPTALSAARLIAGPIVAMLVLWAHESPSIQLSAIASAIFIAAAVTDFLDGVLARAWNVVTPLGAALDHVADKVLIAATLIALSYAYLPVWIVAAGAVLIVRDIAIAGLREGLSASGRTLPVSGAGKVKAALAMIGTSAALLWPLAGLGPDWAPGALYWAAGLSLSASALLAIWSGSDYILGALTD